MNRKMQMLALAIVVFTIVMGFWIFATHSYGAVGDDDPYSLPAPVLQPMCTTVPVTINGVTRLITTCCMNGMCRVQ